ncbi:glutaredoxin-2, mitochondrial isoform X2 [Cimex lectularius]|uniref:Glutaredoxin domain-containing protein n=1 Tax=Cimex lectularius TaxID=79782 RepID=A0A8I6RZ79_CIMLE|nr:glutaredoxin-2, mitochondrial isoform X2 [Cimex lectularius]
MGGCLCCRKPIDYEKLLEQLVHKHRVVIFSKTFCTDSDIAKNIFQMAGADYLAIEMDQLPMTDELMLTLIKKTGFDSIFLDGHFIGGIRELKLYLKSGLLYETLCPNSPLCTTTKNKKTNVNKFIKPVRTCNRRPCQIKPK